MSGRVSTTGMHGAAVAALLDAQARLARTQLQVSSGRRISSPADDPVGAAQLQELTRRIEAGAQYGRNSDAVRSRLMFEEQALSDTTASLNRIRELLLQAGNATVDPASRAMIRTEVAGRVQELLDIANRRDGQGEYLFAGLKTLTQPFERSGTGIVYRGDGGQRHQPVSDTQRVADGDPGLEVYQRVPAGNGTFVTAPDAANAGTGIISVGSVVSPAAWDGGSYTLRFTASDTWQVLDSSGDVVTAGDYTDDGTVAFAGISVQVTGAPAAGDSFLISASAPVGLFDTLADLLGTLGAGTATPADRAKFSSRVGGALAQLDQSLEHMQQTRTGVGVRLAALDAAQTARESLDVDLQALASGIRDLDYAEAVGRLNQQYTALEAAQRSLARVGQLSLFDYL